MSADDAGTLMKFAPADSHLVELHADASAGAASAIEQALFGKLPDQSWSPPEIPDRTRSSSNEDDNTRAQRYSRLDSRFDVDVDDEQAPKRQPGDESQTSTKKASEPPVDEFVKRAGSVLANTASGNYCEMVRSRAEAGKPFVSFDRAVVIQFKPGAALDRDTLERAITDELHARFVVAGTDPKLVWQDDGAVRFVAQTLLQQGAAYSVSGSYLVLASSKEFASDILRAAKAISPAGKVDGPVAYYAVVRVAAAKPVFDTLMSKLDGRTPQTKAVRKDDEEEREIKFFSDNVSSLIAATAIAEIRLSRQSSGRVMTEHVIYSW